jgi:hypothetical protein
MKKTSLILFTVLCVLKINAQSPTLSFTTSNSSYSLTCAEPTINVLASVNNFTSNNVSVVWLPINITSTNVTLNSAANYTVNAYNNSTMPPTLIASNLFPIYSATTPPAPPVISPLSQSISCNPNSVTTVTATAITPTSNLNHYWVSCTGGTLSTFAPTSLFTPGGPCTYTHFLVNAVSGCSVQTTFSVFSTPGYPSYSLTLPSFLIGCNSYSTPILNIINAQSNPPGSPVTFTLLPPSFTNTVFTTGPTTTYSLNQPGTWTVVAKDLVNSCQHKTEISIFNNVFYPSFSAGASSNLICLGQSVVLSTAGGWNTSFTWTPGQLNGMSVAVTPSVNTTYTVSGTLNQFYPNGCVTTKTVSVMVSPCTGLEEQQINSQLSIYPNPNNGEFTLVTETEMLLEITDQLGRLVKTIEVKKGQNEINLTGITQGIYLLSGSSNGKIYKGKMTILH